MASYPFMENNSSDGWHLLEELNNLSYCPNAGAPRWQLMATDKRTRSDICNGRKGLRDLMATGSGGVKCFAMNTVYLERYLLAPMAHYVSSMCANSVSQRATAASTLRGLLMPAVKQITRFFDCPHASFHIFRFFLGGLFLFLLSCI